MPIPTRDYLIRLAKNAELFIGGLFFVIMLGVVVANVFLRYLFETSVLFTEELAYIGFTWSTFAAVAWLYRTKGMISVDVFFMMFPERFQRGLSVLVDLVLIAANLWFCWLSWVLAAGGFVRKTPVLEIPYFWVNLAPLLAFGLMALYSVGHLVQGIRQSGPYRPDPDHDAAMYQDSSL
jgi:TRAP-type C4-dicarboxylate transport system permease small subunit